VQLSVWENTSNFPSQLVTHGWCPLLADQKFLASFYDNIPHENDPIKHVKTIMSLQPIGLQEMIEDHGTQGVVDGQLSAMTTSK
jgi:hypothetical protein